MVQVFTVQHNSGNIYTWVIEPISEDTVIATSYNANGDMLEAHTRMSYECAEFKITQNCTIIESHTA